MRTHSGTNQGNKGKITYKGRKLNGRYHKYSKFFFTDLRGRHYQRITYHSKMEPGWKRWQPHRCEGAFTMSIEHGKDDRTVRYRGLPNIVRQLTR